MDVDGGRARGNLVVVTGLHDAARSIGAGVQLRDVSADTEELRRRIVARDLEGRWGSRSIERHELDGWVKIDQPPEADEVAMYDTTEVP